MAEPEPIIQRIVVEFDDREAQERLARFNDAQARTTERGVGGAASAGAVQMGAFKGGLLAVEAAASLATRAVAGLQRAFNTLKAPVNLGASFQAQIAFIRTLGQELPRGFEAGALELQTRLPQLGADINRALYDAISAGIDPGKALGFVEAASAAAVAGGTDLVKATNTLTTATNAFTELGGDAAKAGDILFATIRAGKTTFEELAATDLGASMASLSVRLAESGALLAEFTKRGQNTSVSLNTIQAIVASIAQPTQEAAREFDRLGVKVGAAALKERGLTAILRDLNTAAGGNVEVISRLTDRKEALRGLLPLLTGGFDAYEKTLRMVETTTGATAQAAREQDNTFEGMQRRLDALVRGTLTKLGVDVLPLVERRMRQLIEFIEANKDGFLRFGKAVYTVIDAFGSVVFETIGRRLATISAQVTAVGDAIAAVTKHLGKLDGVVNAISGLGATVREWGIDVDFLDVLMGDLTSLPGLLDKAGDAGVDAFRSVQRAAAQLSPTLGAVVAAFGSVGEGISTVGDWFDRVANPATMGIEAWRSLAVALDANASAANRLTMEGETLADAMFRSTRNAFAYARAMQAVRDTTKAVKTTIADLVSSAKAGAERALAGSDLGAALFGTKDGSDTRADAQMEAQIRAARARSEQLRERLSFQASAIGRINEARQGGADKAQLRQLNNLIDAEWRALLNKQSESRAAFLARVDADTAAADAALQRAETSARLARAQAEGRTALADQITAELIVADATEARRAATVAATARLQEAERTYGENSKQAAAAREAAIAEQKRIDADERRQLDEHTAALKRAADERIAARVEANQEEIVAVRESADAMRRAIDDAAASERGSVRDVASGARGRAQGGLGAAATGLADIADTTGAFQDVAARDAELEALRERHNAIIAEEEALGHRVTELKARFAAEQERIAQATAFMQMNAIAGSGKAALATLAAVAKAAGANAKVVGVLEKLALGATAAQEVVFAARDSAAAATHAVPGPLFSPVAAIGYGLSATAHAATAALAGAQAAGLGGGGGSAGRSAAGVVGASVPRTAGPPDIASTTPVPQTSEIHIHGVWATDEQAMRRLGASAAQGVTEGLRTFSDRRGAARVPRRAIGR